MNYFVHRSIALLMAGAAIAVLLHRPALAEDDSPVQTVVIGFAGGLGKQSQTNLGFARDGAIMAVDDANQRKISIGGKRITFKLMVVDDQSDANFARVTAKSFIVAGVAGVIGHNTTETSIAVSSLYNEAGIPLISPTATGRQFTQGGYGNVFQLLGHSDRTAIHLANIAVDNLKSKRIAVIDNGTSLGTGIADVFVRQVSKNGGNIMLRESINSKTSDFNNVLSRLKHEDIDLLFFTGVGPQAAAFSQNYQRAGIRATLLLTGGGFNFEFPDAGPHADGTYLLLHGFPLDTRPGYARFEQAYKKQFDSTLTPYTLFAYDAVGMLIEAFRKANSVNPRTAIETLHNMQYKGISGSVSFAADGSQNNPPYTLYKVVQRKWQVIKTFGG